MPRARNAAFSTLRFEPAENADSETNVLDARRFDTVGSTWLTAGLAT